MLHLCSSEWEMEVLLTLHLCIFTTELQRRKKKEGGGQPCDNYDCSDCKKLRLPTLCLKFYFQTVCISGMRVGALFHFEA